MNITRYLELVAWAKKRYTVNGLLPLRKYIPGRQAKEILLKYKRIEESAFNKYIGIEL